MEKEVERELKKLGFVCIPVIIFVALALYEGNVLRRHPKYTTGVVVEIRLGGRSDNVTYEYIVDGKKYTGNEGFNAYSDNVKVGDTCEVVYAATKPGLSDLLRNEDNRLIIHHPRLKNIQKVKRIREKLDKRKKESSGLFD
jgi:hypothetical protein